MKLLPPVLGSFVGFFLTSFLFGQTTPGSEGLSVRGGVATRPAGAPGADIIFGVNAADPSSEPPHEEMETVTFLGVETGRVLPALSAQLNLQEGTGLLVLSTDAGSPSFGAFKPHDILLKLDDQILIVPEQLSVLIRSHKEGDEVAIAYLRGGRSASAKIKLGKHDVPKMTNGPIFGNDVLGVVPTARQEADRLLSVVPRNLGPERMTPTLRIDNHGAPGMRATSVSPANSKLVYSDEAGALELTIKDGQKSLVARDTKATQIFSGPVTTPEERSAMPTTLRKRLEKLESMQGSVFETDGQFKGTESKFIGPPRRSI